ncbi:MAG: CDP-alcohol phosphatidyltransferase family protein [Planctomycetota bacterium]
MPPKRPITLIPNLLTLTNAGLGLLAISKAIDALSSAATPALFERHLEMACWLVLLAGVFDALDGKIARLMNAFSDLGAQLDSFADAITFGVAPAFIAKALLEHEGLAHPRINFVCAAAFTLMAVLRLARFNTETEPDEASHAFFKGLPSPAAAGMVVSTVLMYLSLGGSIEVEAGEPTPLGRGLQVLPLAWREALTTYLLLPTVLVLLPLLGLLMVSRVRYVHMVSSITSRQGVEGLVVVVLFVLGLYLAPVLFLFGFGVFYVFGTLLRVAAQRPHKTDLGSEDLAA